MAKRSTGSSEKRELNHAYVRERTREQGCSPGHPSFEAVGQVMSLREVRTGLAASYPDLRHLQEPPSGFF